MNKEFLNIIFNLLEKIKLYRRRLDSEDIESPN